jgi:hypothetical protein
MLGELKHTELTTDEMRLVQSHIQKLEKQARHWWLQKITAVVCLIVSLGLLFTVNRFISYMKSDTNELYSLIARSKTTCTIEDMRSYVDAKISYLKAEMFMNIKVLLVLMVGATLFVWTFSNREKDKINLLLAKFLRTLLDAHEHGITQQSSGQ